MDIKKYFPSRKEAVQAKEQIEQLERKRQRLQEKRKDLDEKDRALLKSCLAARKRFENFLAAAIGGGLALAGTGTALLYGSLSSEKSPSSISQISSGIKKKSVPASSNDDFMLPPVEGILSKLPPTQTCKVDKSDFVGKDTPSRFAFVMDKCKGRMQKGGKTFLKSTIEGYKINGELIHDLDEIFVSTGNSKGLPYVEYRTFVFHRKDGQDGLPGGNMVDFKPNAMTYVHRKTSHSLTTIPLDGDKAHAVSATATEICQTRMLAEKDDAKAEITCNSFGKAVASIYANINYVGYTKIMRGTAFILEEGEGMHTFEPITREVYGKLEKVLADRPDILIPANSASEK